ncbi:aminoglycoside phosphotransferase family protein [Paenibacillus sp. PL91]|uniref:aminoglycoside phosphotransferase family protein n=1 Tax=Paenibacillus sp. PL91 TaxID=2729538 RepID=UPI00145CE249|nr:aminoglycoside phosphotransferase family protein [Paenibacillus sp. PL91]MBC9201598.1 aminoglycoside phosphotransferase family protein [Paenibacillus sp. PL91]
MDLLNSVKWIEKDEVLDDLLNHEDSLTLHPIDQGYEAEVLRISSNNARFVLKVWNKSSKPDVRFQFRLLHELHERGLSVSRPLGWGNNLSGEMVLLTSFDGTPVHKVDGKKMADIANILASIHQINIEEMVKLHLPKHDFTDYFFPGAREQHLDIYQAVVPLVQKTPIKHEHLIHGDFHLANILEENGRYTVIDWTNGQLGDPRYDFAWSLILKKIYISERYAEVFRSAYLLENDILQEELEVFEALACLRWILLNRNGGTPKGPNTIERVQGLITNNPFLKELELEIFQ